MNSIKTTIEKKAAEYAQAERVRTNLALDEEFATKRSEREKRFDAETEIDERDRVLTYLKSKLTKETYESVLSELRVSSSRVLFTEEPTRINLTSEYSSHKDGKDILDGKAMVEKALNETSCARSVKSNQGTYFLSFPSLLSSDKLYTRTQRMEC